MSVLEDWVPRTKLGRLVKKGQITNIEDIFKMGLPIKEVEIVETLLPDLQEKVVEINLVQKQTDAGEISRFKATVVVGNQRGYVGVGEGKAKEINPAITIAIRNAKLNVIPVRLGCGSWECGCGTPHSIPFKVRGKSGSVEVVLLPAPKGTGLVAADAAKVVLSMAGVKDVWSRSRGHTKTTPNFVKAVYNALKQTYQVVAPWDWTL